MMKDNAVMMKRADGTVIYVSKENVEIFKKCGYELKTKSNKDNAKNQKGE